MGVSNPAILIDGRSLIIPAGFTGSFTYTFTAADAGKHTFWLTFGTTGKQSLKVADSAASLTNSTDVRVFAALPLPKRGGWFI